MPPSRFHYVCAVLFSRAHRGAASEIIRRVLFIIILCVCVFGRSRAPRNELFKLCYGLNQSLVRGNVPSQHKASPRTITNRFLSRAAQCDVLERDAEVLGRMPRHPKLHATFGRCDTILISASAFKGGNSYTDNPIIKYSKIK